MEFFADVFSIDTKGEWTRRANHQWRMKWNKNRRWKMRWNYKIVKWKSKHTKSRDVPRLFSSSSADDFKNIFFALLNSWKVWRAICSGERKTQNTGKMRNSPTGIFTETDNHSTERRLEMDKCFLLICHFYSFESFFALSVCLSTFCDWTLALSIFRILLLLSAEFSRRVVIDVDVFGQSPMKY